MKDKFQKTIENEPRDKLERLLQDVLLKAEDIDDVKYSDFIYCLIVAVQYYISTSIRNKLNITDEDSVAALKIEEIVRNRFIGLMDGITDTIKKEFGEG